MWTGNLRNKTYFKDTFHSSSSTYANLALLLYRLTLLQQLRKSVKFHLPGSFRSLLIHITPTRITLSLSCVYNSSGPSCAGANFRRGCWLSRPWMAWETSSIFIFRNIVFQRLLSIHQSIIDFYLVYFYLPSHLKCTCIRLCVFIVSWKLSKYHIVFWTWIAAASKEREQN